MLIYRVSRYVNDPRPTYVATQEEGHDILRGTQGEPDARLELLEVGTDKGTVLFMLNRMFDDTPDACKVLKTWLLTIRRGLALVSNGE